MSRWFVGVGSAVALCLATVHAQTAKPAVRSQFRVIDPGELSGPPKPLPSQPSSAQRRFAESDVFRALDPKKPETIAPALSALNDLLKEEPNSDMYFMRALVGCEAKVAPKSMLSDLATALSIRPAKTESSAFTTKREMYALKAKIEFDSGEFKAAADDLENAIKEDYESAPQTFNSGKPKPSLTAKPCEWTQADLNLLTKEFPRDYRPPLFLGLYLAYFTTYDPDTDSKPIFAAFDRAAELNPVSPLPSFYTADAYLMGRLGGMMSTTAAKCIDDITPRTKPCLELDELHRTGLRWVTKAIAIDPTFAPAYTMRAEGLYRMKEHRQAVRDYDKALELHPTDDGRRGLYNDRGLAKLELKDYQGAIANFTSAIALGCDEPLCLSYENRALAYMKMHNYSKAVADYTMVIRQRLSNDVFLMNIDQFRRIYPEYDTVADDAVAEKLRLLFFPEMARDVFAKNFLIEATELKSFLLPELYLSRGDAYAKLGDSKKANTDYDRVSHGFPEWAKTAFTEVGGKRVRNPE
jgi:tetratricopeptide (TPR) repeat protein